MIMFMVFILLFIFLTIDFMFLLTISILASAGLMKINYFNLKADEKATTSTISDSTKFGRPF